MHTGQSAGEVLPLERAAEAMERIQHGGAKGKVVLRTGLGK